MEDILISVLSAWSLPVWVSLPILLFAYFKEDIYRLFWNKTHLERDRLFSHMNFYLRNGIEWNNFHECKWRNAMIKDFVYMKIKSQLDFLHSFVKKDLDKMKTQDFCDDFIRWFLKTVEDSNRDAIAMWVPQLFIDKYMDLRIKYSIDIEEKVKAHCRNKVFPKNTSIMVLILADIYSMLVGFINVSFDTIAKINGELDPYNYKWMSLSRKHEH